jgi:hypothetical protein
VFPERGWRPDQGVGTLDSKLGREPRSTQNPRLGPGRRREIVLGREMLGQRCQQGIPPLVTEGQRLIVQQTRLSIVLDEPVAVEESGDLRPVSAHHYQLHELLDQLLAGGGLRWFPYYGGPSPW